VRHAIDWVINILAVFIKRARPTTPHLLGMKRKTAHIDIRVEPQLVERIDNWCDRQLVRPSRSAAIVHMIENFLAARSTPRDTPGMVQDALGRPQADFLKLTG
jgi:hypothetical protein